MKRQYFFLAICTLLAMSFFANAQKIRNNNFLTYTLLPPALVFAPEAKPYFLDYHIPTKLNSDDDLNDLKPIKKLTKEIKAASSAAEADIIVEINSPGISNVAIDNQKLYSQKTYGYLVLILTAHISRGFIV